jgi:hypothetical protein
MGYPEEWFWTCCKCFSSPNNIDLAEACTECGHICCMICARELARPIEVWCNFECRGLPDQFSIQPKDGPLGYLRDEARLPKISGGELNVVESFRPIWIWLRRTGLTLNS